MNLTTEIKQRFSFTNPSKNTQFKKKLKKKKNTNTSQIHQTFHVKIYFEIFSRISKEATRLLINLISLTSLE